MMRAHAWWPASASARALTKPRRPCPALNRSWAGLAGICRTHAPPARGIALLEVLVVLAIFLVLVGFVAPSFSEWRTRQQLRGAVTALQLSVWKIRVAAAASGRSHGLALSLRQGDLFWETVVDGDHDGIRREDIRSGSDPVLEPERSLCAWFPGIAPGRPGAAPPLSGGSSGQGGLALGRSRILSAAPDGSTTSGTIYLFAKGGHGAALRFYGPTGRDSLWLWDPRASQWKPLE
jgi:type II secretory pathway pseudopilin PulG